MKFDKKSLLLYLVTDRSWLETNSLESQVEKAILGGCTFVQLREKNLADEDFIQLGRKIKKVTSRYQVPFVINDNVAVALTLDADGVHIGQSDASVHRTRQLIGPKKILGVSVQTVDQAKKAESEGADYLGVGAVFATTTKDDADKVALTTLKSITKEVSIPVVAIGGIHDGNTPLLSGSGVSGIAVVSAILAKKNVREAAELMYEIAKENFK